MKPNGKERYFLESLLVGLGSLAAAFVLFGCGIPGPGTGPAQSEVHEEAAPVKLEKARWDSKAGHVDSDLLKSKVVLSGKCLTVTYKDGKLKVGEKYENLKHNSSIYGVALFPWENHAVRAMLWSELLGGGEASHPSDVKGSSKIYLSYLPFEIRTGVDGKKTKHYFLPKLATWTSSPQKPVYYVSCQSISNEAVKEYMRSVPHYYPSITFQDDGGKLMNQSKAESLIRIISKQLVTKGDNIIVEQGYSKDQELLKDFIPNLFKRDLKAWVRDTIGTSATPNQDFKSVEVFVPGVQNLIKTLKKESLFGFKKDEKGRFLVSFEKSGKRAPAPEPAQCKDPQGEKPVQQTKCPKIIPGPTGPGASVFVRIPQKLHSNLQSLEEDFALLGECQGPAKHMMDGPGGSQVYSVDNCPPNAKDFSIKIGVFESGKKQLRKNNSLHRWVHFDARDVKGKIQVNVDSDSFMAFKFFNDVTRRYVEVQSGESGSFPINLSHIGSEKRFQTKESKQTYQPLCSQRHKLRAKTLLTEETLSLPLGGNCRGVSVILPKAWDVISRVEVHKGCGKPDYSTTKKGDIGMTRLDCFLDDDKVKEIIIKPIAGWAPMTVKVDQASPIDITGQIRPLIADKAIAQFPKVSGRAAKVSGKHACDIQPAYGIKGVFLKRGAAKVNVELGDGNRLPFLAETTWSKKKSLPTFVGLELFQRGPTAERYKETDHLEWLISGGSYAYRAEDFKKDLLPVHFDTKSAPYGKGLEMHHYGTLEKCENKPLANTLGSKLVKYDKASNGKGLARACSYGRLLGASGGGKYTTESGCERFELVEIKNKPALEVALERISCSPSSKKKGRTVIAVTLSRDLGMNRKQLLNVLLSRIKEMRKTYSAQNNPTDFDIVFVKSDTEIYQALSCKDAMTLPEKGDRNSLWKSLNVAQINISRHPLDAFKDIKSQWYATERDIDFIFLTPDVKIKKNDERWGAPFSAKGLQNWSITVLTKKSNCDVWSKRGGAETCMALTETNLNKVLKKKLK